MNESQNNNSKEFNDLCDKVKEVTKGYIGDPLTQDQMKKMGDNVAHMFSTMFQDDHIKCVDVKNDPLNKNAIVATISIPKKGSKSWFTYMVRCQNSAIYTGITDNVSKRIDTHNSGKGSKSCRAHGLPVKLEVTIEQPDKSSALKLEAKIKKLSKIQKEQFIDAYKQDVEDQKQQIQHPIPLIPNWSADPYQKTITERMKEYRGLCLYMSTKITNEPRMGV